MPSQCGCPYLNVELKQRTDAFLKIFFRYGFTKQTYTGTLMDSTMHDLFKKIKALNQSFYLLPPQEQLHQILRKIGHGFELPRYKYKLHKQTQSFLTSCLFKYS